MNLIQMQDRFRGLPDSALHTAASQPGQYQFLAMAEMAERQKIRGAHAAQAQEAQPTVAQRIMGGNDVPAVESPRMDIGGLAAASNRGDMQPAIGMYKGGLVPATGMAQGGEPPAAPEVPAGFQRMPDGSVREIEKVEVLGQRGRAPEPSKQLAPAGDTIYDMLRGTGLFKDSGGMFGPSRANRASMLDEFGAKYEAATPADRIAPMLAAQVQDRERNTQMENRDRWLALAQAGLGAAAGTSQDFLTNIVGGAQAGLGALRAGMTESERRNAAVQARGDSLEQARMAQEAVNAAARRRSLDLSIGIESDAEKADQTLATNMYGDRIKLDAEKDMLGRRLTSEERRNAADNAAAYRRAALNESGANYRAGVSEAGANSRAQLSANVQRAEINQRANLDRLNRDDRAKGAIGSEFADLTTRLASAYKLGETAMNAPAAARAWEAEAKRLVARYNLPTYYASMSMNPFAAESSVPAAPKKGSMTREEFARALAANPQAGGTRAAQD